MATALNFVADLTFECTYPVDNGLRHISLTVHKVQRTVFLHMQDEDWYTCVNDVEVPHRMLRCTGSKNAKAKSLRELARGKT